VDFERLNDADRSCLCTGWLCDQEEPDFAQCSYLFGDIEYLTRTGAGLVVAQNRDISDKTWTSQFNAYYNDPSLVEQIKNLVK
jgi:hypothetical protein